MLDGGHEKILGRDKGRYSFTKRATIFSFTCSPFVTFCISRRMPSQAKNASGSEMRRLAESSSVRSRPLRGGCHRRVHCVRHNIPGERADALAAHGVSLIGHRRRANLRGLKRLFRPAGRAAKGGYRSRTGSSSARWMTERSKSGCQASGDRSVRTRHRDGQSRSLRQFLVHLVDFCVVVLKERDEACLRAGCAAAA